MKANELDDANSVELVIGIEVIIEYLMDVRRF